MTFLQKAVMTEQQNYALDKSDSKPSRDVLHKSLVGIVQKVLLFLGSIFVLTVMVFTISRLTPMDPLVSYYGERVEKMSAEEKESAREKLGLNQPILTQYTHWVSNALQGEFGISYKYKQDVTEVIGQRAGNTFLLGGIGFVLIFTGSLGLGMLCAFYEDRSADRVLCKLGTLTGSIPEFWLSLVLILIFSVTLKWLPSGGAYSVGNDSGVTDRMMHLILPLTVMVSTHLWYYAYMIRNRLLEEVRGEYVLLCKAKGLSRGQILFRHCLRSVLPSYISIMSVSLPHILGGTYIVETVFSYPGLGTLAYESARYADYNLLMLLSVMTGATVLFFSFVGQAVNEHIDPRLKASKTFVQEEVSRL